MLVKTQNTIRIAHVLPTFDIGGLENGVVNLINHMDGAVFKHLVIALAGDAKASDRIHRPFELEKIDKRSGNDPTVPWKLAKLFREHNVDIVRTYAWGSWMEGALGALLSGPRKHIHSEHGFIINDDCKVPRRQRIAQFFLSKLTTQIVAVSESIRSSLIEHVSISPDKIATIVNGVDTNKFSPPGNKTRVKGLEFPDDTQLVAGIVARLDPVKDHKTAIESVLKNDKVVLLIIGDGPERKSLESYVTEKRAHNRIKFLGNREDIPELLSCLDIYLLSSLREGTSNTLLEAMSCAVPVLASAVGGSLKIVRHGENGFLFPAGDASALGSLIANRLTDRLAFDSAAAVAREEILAKYSLNRMVRDYEALFKAVLVRP